MKTGNIKGPQLVVHREKCLSNIEFISGKARGPDILFRPHFKTHQSLSIGKWFRQSGINSITVSSINMAYYFARDGWDDILVGIAYNPREYDLYERLSEKCNLIATVTCPETCRILSNQCRFPLEVMIKIDTGYNRTGIRWDDPEGLGECIKHLGINRNIKIRGLMTHDGSTYGLNSRERIIRKYKESVTRIKTTRQNSGLKDFIISVGDTPSASVVDDFHGIDELRPGNFVFYDLMQYINGSCQFENIAAALLCPVIDIRPDSQTVVIHGGAIHLSRDSIIINGKQVFGMVAGLDNEGWYLPDHKTYLTSISQEHGIIHCPESKLFEQLLPGDLLAIIPVHSCLTADCMGSYMLFDGKIIDHMRQVSQDSLFSLL